VLHGAGGAAQFAKKKKRVFKKKKPVGWGWNKPVADLDGFLTFLSGDLIIKSEKIECSGLINAKKKLGTKSSFHF